jgi:hypothetical protein
LGTGAGAFALPNFRFSCDDELGGSTVGCAGTTDELVGFPSQGLFARSAFFSGSWTPVGLSRHNLDPSVQLIAMPSQIQLTTLDRVWDSRATTYPCVKSEDILDFFVTAHKLCG